MNNILEKIINDDKKFLQLTHTDLDGYTCKLMTSIYIQNEFDCYHLNYDNIIRKLNYLIKTEHNDYSGIIITDLDISNELFILIYQISKEFNIPFLIFDHHQNSLKLKEKYETFKNKNDNLYFEVADDHECATKLYYKFLSNNLEIENINEVRLDCIIETINDWDTFSFKDKEGNILNENALKLNNYTKLFGFDATLELITNYIKVSGNMLFNDNEESSLSTYQFIIDKEYERQNKNIKVIEDINIDGINYTIGFISCNDNISEIASKIAVDYKDEVDFVVNLNFVYRSASFRCYSDDIDLSMIAKHFGGGGHKKASACPITVDFLNEIGYTEFL
jgi:oligoribonuclease NrnB/cAMP/cGMP phosphodiesterase (DHH superfamily)